MKLTLQYHRHGLGVIATAECTGTLIDGEVIVKQGKVTGSKLPIDLALPLRYDRTTGEKLPKRQFKSGWQLTADSIRRMQDA